MEQKDKKNNIFYITHSGEFLIWLIIIFIIILFSTLILSVNEKNNNDYHIFLQDVDGLIVGSPVRMMGIEVGYITKIRPTHDEVFVKFLISDSNLKIPHGTIATVEFSGMAGSKSLELYLPDKQTYVDSSTPIITVSSPKRLHDALGLLNDMFDKIGAIIYTSSNFSNNLKDLNINQGKEQDFDSFLEYSETLINNYNIRAENLKKKLVKYGK